MKKEQNQGPPQLISTFLSDSWSVPLEIKEGEMRREQANPRL